MIGRRTLMRSGLFAALAPTLALVAGPLAPRRAAAAGPTARLAGIFREPASARAIGRAYLRQAPEEADAARPLDLIHPGDCAALSTTELRRAVAARQRADFAAGRTVLLDGWVLSRTEARLCAFAAVTA
jgi:hypothetical protein